MLRYRRAGQALQTATVLLVTAACAAGGATPAVAPSSAPSIEPAAELASLAERMRARLSDLPLDSAAIPRSLDAAGELDGRPARDWTSGFFPGVLWQLHAATGDESLGEAAATWTAFVREQARDTTHHDLGFQVYCSFGEGYEATGREDYRDVVVEAARSLATRYDERVGAIRSWDWNAEEWAFPVIVDNLMNLELLFEATRLTGDSAFHHIADQHAATTLANHFRPDHSSYHVVDYDPASGAARAKVTHQGAADESAWARGQAWALYGYAMAHRYTRRADYLQQARDVADYFFTHPRMPPDGVPYWDFDAPGIPDAPRDASAAAVAVSGLLELRDRLPADDPDRPRYTRWAQRTLGTLASDAYETDAPPFLLAHSTGHHPAGTEIDVPIVYADYYYVEALRRLAGDDPR